MVSEHGHSFPVKTEFLPSLRLMIVCAEYIGNCDPKGNRNDLQELLL